MATNPRTPRSGLTKWIVAGTLAGSVLGGVGIAAAQDTGSTTTAPPASSSSATPSKPDRAMSPETPLTGETADKVKAAALAAVPGATVDRTETDNDGSPYEAHITKSDGTHAVVKVDANFSVTAVEDDKGPGGHGGPGGRGGKGGAGETPLTGETADKVKAAAQAAVPGGTVERTETDNDGSPYEAHVTKADGTRVTVKVDSNFGVTSVDNG